MNGFSLPLPYIGRSDHPHQLFPRTNENLHTNGLDFDFSFEWNSIMPSTLGTVHEDTSLNNGQNTKQQIIMHASKEDLIKYQNIDYMRLHTEYEMLRKEYSRLYELNATIFNKMLNSVQNKPLDEPNLLLTPTSRLQPQPQQSEHSHIPYWFKQDWVSYTKGRATTTLRLKPSDDDCEPLKFITDENGTPVNKQQARYIRSTTKNIWQTLLKANRAPLTWGQADMSALEYYRNNMYTKFPYLKLCDNDWKVDWIATMDYPGWHRRHCEQTENTRFKREAESVPPESTHPLKRAKFALVPNVPSPTSPSPTSPSPASPSPASPPPASPPPSPAPQSSASRVTASELIIRKELRPKPRPVARKQFQSQIATSAPPQIANPSVLQSATPFAIQERTNVLESAVAHCVTPRSACMPPPSIVNEPALPLDIPSQSAINQHAIPQNGRPASSSKLSISHPHDENDPTTSVHPSSTSNTTSVSGGSANYEESVQSPISSETLAPIITLVDPFAGRVNKLPEVAPAVPSDGMNPPTRPVRPRRQTEKALNSSFGQAPGVAQTKPDNGALFKYNKASATTMNLFGLDYIQHHSGKVTKAEVLQAFESLTKEQLAVYEKKREELLAGRKTKSKNVRTT